MRRGWEGVFVGGAGTLPGAAPALSFDIPAGSMLHVGDTRGGQFKLQPGRNTSERVPHSVTATKVYLVHCSLFTVHVV